MVTQVAATAPGMVALQKTGNYYKIVSRSIDCRIHCLTKVLDPCQVTLDYPNMPISLRYDSFSDRYCISANSEELLGAIRSLRKLLLGHQSVILTPG